jgi:serine protease Do
MTDCTLVGGDSGGPLFDMTGKVVGVHSRIGGAITFNIHVPVDTYKETWDRLVASEVWGSNAFGFNFGRRQEGGDAYLGIRADPDAKLFKILAVTPESPAEKAGLRPDDVILKIDNLALASLDELNRFLRGQRPGNRISVQIERGGERLTLNVTLGKRPA